jgi:hypothetical protein
MREGFFRMKSSDGKTIFEGNYLNDNKDGFGVIIKKNETY